MTSECSRLPFPAAPEEKIGRIAAALSAWIFRDDVSLLTPEMLCGIHRRELIFPLLQKQLSETSLSRTEKIFLRRYAVSCRQYTVWQKIETLFRENQIPYCPIKGADLAWRVYPANVCRRQSDIDILVPKSAHARAMEVLLKAGGESRYPCQHAYHAPGVLWQGISIELHWNLPLFPDFTAEEIWRDMRQKDPFRRELPLEINLLMLFAHARSHHWATTASLLLDSGFLLRREGALDWKKLSELAEKFGMASPVLLFQAFPDFFPEEMPRSEAPPPKILQAFRRTLLHSPLDDEQIVEKELGRTDRFSLDWWKKRIRAMKISAVRKKTHNSQGNYGKLFRDYCTILCRKIRLFWRYRHGAADPEIRQRLNDEKTIETFLTAKNS